MKGRKLGFKSTTYNIGKKETLNQNRKKKQELKKKENEDSIRRLWDISKRANIQIIGVPEGEEEEQDMENLLKK